MKSRNETHGGDDCDRSVFNTHFMLARGQGLIPKLTKDQVWMKAQEKVTEDLNNAEFKAMVLKTAGRIEAEYFPT
jgi:hypothetical protein